MILCPRATWNPVSITVVNNTTIRGYPNTIFIDQTNQIYLTSTGRNPIEVGREGNTSQWRQIASGLKQSRGLFVSSSGEIFVDNGLYHNRVERWTWKNLSNVTTVMNVNQTCFSLFLGPNDNLYCSLSNLHQVVSKSLQSVETIPTVVASGLAFPRGIFVDSFSNLYVADWGNNSIEYFPPGELNGRTIAGNGIPNNLILFTPIGLVVDADGSLFILEEITGRILRTNANDYLCLIGCNSSQLLNGPSSFQFDNLGNLFVVDRNNLRIQKFLLSINSCGQSRDDLLLR